MFVLTMTTVSRLRDAPPAVPLEPAVKQATFADEDTMRLCDLGWTARSATATVFVRDEPIIPRARRSLPLIRGVPAAP